MDPIVYATPILASLDSDPQLDMVLDSSYTPARALDHSLHTLWASSGPNLVYPYGALAPCEPGPVLVEGTFAVPAQLTLTQASGGAAGTATSLVLASGAAYANAAAATAAGAASGQLGDVAVSGNLDGSGLGPTALVGLTDGFLYAVDPALGRYAGRWASEHP